MNPLLFLDISGGELLLVIIVAFLVFGPKKLPDFARRLGRGIGELRKTADELNREFKQGSDQVKNDFSEASSEFLAKKIENTTEIRDFESNNKENNDISDKNGFTKIYANTESHTQKNEDPKATRTDSDGLLF